MNNGHSNGNGQGGRGGGLDMGDGRDRAVLRKGIADGYGITPEIMAEFFDALTWALREGKEAGDRRCIASCNRTLTTMVGQMQAEDPGIGTDPRIVVQFDRPEQP